ncbi:MAG: CvpA family protein [Chloroflexota bacterium]
MNWVDLVIAGTIAWSTFSAFRQGLIRVVVSLLSTVLGAVLAGRLYGRLADNIDFLIADSAVRNLVAFVAIFAGLIVLGQIASIFLRTASSVLFLGPMDHLGGAVFGLIQGVLTVELLLFALTTFPAVPGLNSGLEGSTLAPIFIQRIPFFEQLLPVEFRAAIDNFRAGAIPGLPSMLPGGGLPAGIIPGLGGGQTPAGKP